MPKAGRAPDGFYTAKEAMSIIGIPSASFYMLVNSGILKRTIPAGRREGFYSKNVVDSYARNQIALMSGTADKLEFGLALVEDLSAIHDLTASVSGGTAHAVPVDVLQAWIRKNPESIHILRRDSDVYGYISMFPLTREALMERLAGKRLNRSIPVDDIQIFATGEDTPIYVAEMAVKHQATHLKNNEPDPENPDPQARLLGARLIRETGRFLARLKAQGAIINELYAVGTSQFGIQMSRDLGMTAMDLPTGVREDRIPFRLDLTKDVDSILVRRIIKA